MSDLSVMLGPLEDLINDKNNKEILVNGKSQVLVERNGELKKTSIFFNSDEEVLNLAKNIAKHCGETLSSSKPIVAVRITGHFYAHLIIPPISMNGNTIITIFNISPN